MVTLTNSKWSKSVFFSIIVLIALNATNALANDPKLVFHTIDTPHFRIHYDSGLEALARRTARIAEDTHARLSKRLRWDVDGPTDVRLVDNSDSANGMASALESPYVLLYASPPEIDASLQYHDDWLRTLFIHEYTHIIHLQMQHGVARVVNKVFGDVYLPNAMQPRWFIEGLAVMQETFRTTRGRIRSPYYHMILRSHALSSTLQSLDRASHTTYAYPRGVADYAYGAMFMDYLRHRFSEEHITKLCHLYAGAVIPYGLNRSFRKVFGHSLIELYDDWLASVRQMTATEKDRVIREGETSSDVVVADSETLGQPLFSADGQRVFVAMGTSEERAAVYTISLEDGTRRRLFLSNSDSTVQQTSTGDLYFNRRAPYRGTYYFSDLFVMPNGDSSDAAPVRLTRGKRIRDFSVGQSKVLAVMQDKGRTRMSLLWMSDDTETVILPAHPQRQYYSPRMSADQQQAAVVIRDGAAVNIALVDLDTGAWRYITQNANAIEKNLAFSPDGQYLLFASAANGISNIYAYTLETGVVRQLTNVLTGADKPALSSDGRSLLFTLYDASGWHLHQTNIDVAYAPIVANYALLGSPNIEASTPMAEAPKVRLHPYNPIPSFVPKAWHLTYTTNDEVQLVSASINMEDAVGLHSLSTTANYDAVGRTPSLASVYSFRGMAPDFSLGVSYVATEMKNGYLVNGREDSWIKRTIDGQMGMSLSLPALDDRHSVGMNYQLRQSEPRDNLEVSVDPSGPLPTVPTQYFRAGLGFYWSYANLYASPVGVSTEKGRSLNAGFQVFNPVFGGGQDLTKLSFSWSEYLQLPWLSHHVLAMRFNTSAYFSSPRGQGSFSAGGYLSQDLLSAIMNGTFLGIPRIRGYAADSIYGDRYLSYRMEYRFPLFSPEYSYESFPFFFRRVHAGVFFDNLIMAYDQLGTDAYYASVGGELVWSFYSGYHMPLVLRTGYARGLYNGGINEFIFVLGGTY